jgi:hypothetical protein
MAGQVNKLRIEAPCGEALAVLQDEVGLEAMPMAAMA